MLTIAALPILISSKAYQLVELSFLAIRNHSSVLETARDRYYLLSFAIEPLDPLWSSDYLSRVLASLSVRLDVNARLEICACSPAVYRVIFVDCKAVPSS